MSGSLSPRASERPASGTALGFTTEIGRGVGGEEGDLLLRPLLLVSVSHVSRVDLVVHSLKDLPTVLPPGFTIGAICK